ncbi:hypothetical protein A2U01_0103219, partial [Trifolium medium]|nr:hypothetical protein [Trifolium medium]
VPLATASARRERKVERPPRPRRHCQRQPELELEIQDDELSDLMPLQVEMRRR